MSKTVRVMWNGPRIAASERAAAERGVLLAAEHVLGVSTRRVPVEDGALERSGVASAQGTYGAVSYDTPYAVRQHEDLTMRHDRGRQAKYLESALTSEQGAVQQIVAAAIRDGIGG